MPKAEYDGIAGVFDETRRPIDDETLKGLASMMSARGCRSVLEIGIGTGRVAAPLMKAGLETSGVDISRQMMERARSKGVTTLVLAEGTRVPFRDGSFDAALLAHVIHFFEDPRALLLEGARVSRVGVFALLRKRNEDGGWLPRFGEGRAGDRASRERREWYGRLAEKYHWSLDPGRVRDLGRERDLMERDPPDALVKVSDAPYTDTLEDRIGRVRKEAYSFLVGMPEGMKEEIVAEIRRREAERAPRERRVVHEVAFWGSKALVRGRGARGPGGRASPP